MAVTVAEDSIVFACYSKACAPPPVGRGGSVKGGRKGGSVIRKSGGGDSSSTRKVSGAGAKALTRRFGTARAGMRDTGNRKTTVAKGGQARKPSAVSRASTWNEIAARVNRGRP